MVVKVALLAGHRAELRCSKSSGLRVNKVVISVAVITGGVASDCVTLALGVASVSAVCAAVFLYQTVGNTEGSGDTQGWCVSRCAVVGGRW